MKDLKDLPSAKNEDIVASGFSLKVLESSISKVGDALLGSFPNPFTDH